MKRVLFFGNFFEFKTVLIKAVKGFGGVYIFQNKLNGKRYVGSSINLSGRLSNYFQTRGGENSPNFGMAIYRALLKYGFDNFSLTVILIPDATRESVLALEQHVMDTLNPEYNILKVAGSSAGYKHSEEHNSRISETMVGHSMPESTKAKISVSMAGELNPNFGKPGQNLPPISVFVFDAVTKELMISYPSIKVAAKEHHMSEKTISKYLNTGVVYRGVILSSSSTL